MKNRLNWKSIYQNPSFPSFLILIAIIFLNAFLQHNFFTYRAFKSNLLTFTPLILTSIAQGLVILVGCVDLSLGATISLITVLMASLMGDSLLSMVIVVFIGSGWMRPLIIRAKVVLPEPFAPTRPQISPWLRVKLASERATTPSKLFFRFLASRMKDIG
jgi:predicted ABC-type sugar transport system permease subunit